jgi:hypothetical protein
MPAMQKTAGWCAGLGTAVLLVVNTAAAQSAPRYHDKLYLRFAAGLAHYSDAVESEPLPVLGVATGTIKGIAPAFDLAAGYTLIPGLVVGGGLYYHLIPSPVASNAHSNLGNFPEDIEFGTTTLVLIGPFADYYFDPRSGFHVEASIAYGIQSLGEGRGSNTNQQYVQEQSGGGVALMAGIGYEWWVSDGWSLGALGRITAGWGSGSDRQGYEWNHNVLVPALLVSATMN